MAIDTLELVTSRSEGRHEMKVRLSKNKMSVTTNSNLFLNDKNSFGSFEIKNNNSDISKKIDYYIKQLVELDNALKLKGSSLNKLYPKSNHDLFYKIDNIVVTKKNPYFEKINKLIFDKIDNSDLKFTKKYTYKGGDLFTQIKNEKKKIERLDRQKVCNGTGNSGVCKIKDLGFIVL